MENNEIMVSVSCLVYNHEKYLRQCLDGFVMQQTNFKFEVLVHDDASTDGSADIIREYEAKYPDIIKPIYQAENQYSQRIPISRTYQYPRARGKYYAECEGDDFWIDPLKLQKQFDAMEKFTDCSMCVCKVNEVLEDGSNTGYTFPNYQIQSGVIIKDVSINKQLTDKQYRFHTSSFFFRMNYINDYCKEFPRFCKIAPVGDAPILLYMSTKGDIYYINDTGACYRRFSVSSWTNTIRKKNIDKIIPRFSEMYREFDVYTNRKYHDAVQYAVLQNEFNLEQINKNYKEMLNTKYYRLFDKLSIKEKIYIYLAVYMPFIIKIHQKVRK